ncbi:MULTISPECIES: hypothetical protein [Pseudomonas fluorescens group]|uniref:hypothetical protein n=1 Tax=Pseudomonas fluorescens group TaxID=136843 RepID=UPI001F257C59|nr:hypothetical protein [Pseudomonas marginalis]MCM2377971.1 hypothetical protein [Pseudomonas marginalis]
MSTTPMLVGSPKNVADEIERRFIEGAVDGFNIHVDTLEDFSRFTDQVLPLLRARRLSRSRR